MMLAALQLGCSDESDIVDPVEGAGGMGGGMSGGPTGCAPGTAPQADGSCAPAGVSLCGNGMQMDATGSCNALLPAACPPGTMALPGEDACREIGDCGTDVFPSVPLNAVVQYVDGSYAGLDSDGTEGKPWLTLQEGKRG